MSAKDLPNWAWHSFKKGTKKESAESALGSHNEDPQSVGAIYDVIHEFGSSGIEGMKDYIIEKYGERNKDVISKNDFEGQRDALEEALNRDLISREEYEKHIVEIDLKEFEHLDEAGYNRMVKKIMQNSWDNIPKEERDKLRNERIKEIENEETEQTTNRQGLAESVQRNSNSGSAENTGRKRAEEERESERTKGSRSEPRSGRIDYKEINESIEKAKDSKNKSSLDNFKDKLDKTIKDLEDFNKGTLGSSNIVAKTAEVFLKAVREGIYTGESIAKAFESAKEKIKKTDWYKSLSDKRKSDFEGTEATDIHNRYV